MKSLRSAFGSKISADFSDSMSKHILLGLVFLTFPQIILTAYTWYKNKIFVDLLLLCLEIFFLLLALLFLALERPLARYRPLLTIAFPSFLGGLISYFNGVSSVGPLWITLALMQFALFFELKGYLVGLGIIAIAMPSSIVQMLAKGHLATPVPQIIVSTINFLTISAMMAWPFVHIIKKISGYYSENIVLDAQLQKERVELQVVKQSAQEETSLRKSAQALLAEREAKYRGILEFSRDLAVLVDKESTILFAAGGLCQALGWQIEELVGTRVSTYIHPDDREPLFASFEKLISLPNTSSRDKLRFRNKMGDYVQLEGRGSNRLTDPAVQGIIINFRDLTEIAETEEKIAYLQAYDQLTELPNRARFTSRLNEEISRAKGRGRIFAVIAIGIDRFKRINDYYGTEVGDQVLKQAAISLLNTFRQGDLIARLRGDKFLVLLSDMQKADDIGFLVRKANSSINRSYEVPDGKIEVTCSTGVAFYPNDGLSASNLIKNAETAMYMAKEDGRAAWRIFDSRLNKRIVELQKIEDEINIALEENKFLAWYQPKISRSGHIVGMEALARWSLADGGIRNPGEFIPAAERTGAIVHIGHSMLSQACSQIVAWANVGIGNVPISVNLSPRQFKDANLIKDIHDIVLKYQVPSHLIELELTESSILADKEDALRKLLELRDLGFKISIDDFGSGYSSFAKLKDYPIDCVKIDKSFIDPLPEDSKANIVTKAIIELAHALECTVLAEGVEYEEQVNFLKHAGCDSFQGYFYSKPLPNNEATLFIHGLLG